MPFTFAQFEADRHWRAAARNRPPLRRGMRSSGVRLLQAALMDLGFAMPKSIKPTGETDGSFGEETLKAVKQFQSSRRLVPDGLAGTQTLNALDMEIAALMGRAFLAKVGEPRLVIIHDTRLDGAAPTADMNITVDGSASLISTLARVQRYANQQAMPVDLAIMCHGYETHNDTVGQRSTVRGIGGLGLQLCKEDLKITTVNQCKILQDYVDTITVFSCSAADTAPGYAGSAWDGQRLFSTLSTLTSATVYAADATQWYNRTVMANASSNVIDFGKFEGNLWMFQPDGSKSVVTSNPLGP